MKVLKVVLIILLAVVLLAAAFAAGAVAAGFYIIKPMGGAKPVRITVPKGAGAGQVAEKLEKKGLVRHAILFRLAVRVTDSGRDIKPGKYLVDPNKNIMEILSQIKKGEGKLRLITVPEGLTMKQIAKLMEKENAAKAQEFIKSARDDTYKVDGKILKKVEGYLLPDTYDFPARYKAPDIIGKMVDAFNKNAVPLYKKKKDDLPKKLTLHQVVTLASMVEREAQVPSERPVIAAVYYNRMKRGMRLECDATVQYALGKTKQYLKYSDLKVKSPYNTYLHEGLPPGPIANPGIKSIKAVLNPEKHDYLYYVRNDVKNDGSHVFSKTYQQHRAAIQKYQK